MEASPNYHRGYQVPRPSQDLRYQEHPLEDPFGRAPDDHLGQLQPLGYAYEVQSSGRPREMVQGDLRVRGGLEDREAQGAQAVGAHREAQGRRKGGRRQEGRARRRSGEHRQDGGRVQSVTGVHRAATGG